MRLDAAPIWETWNAGGAIIGDNKANARVTVDPDWYLTLDTAARVRGRGTWWRDDPSTLSPFAMASSWMVDSRLRSGARAFQRVRDGEWTYWTGETGVGSLSVPTEAMTRAQMAAYLKDIAVIMWNEYPDITQSLPAYDGTPDYTDISGETAQVQEAIGQLSQAGVYYGFPDGTFKPSDPITETQKAATLARLEDYLWGTATEARPVMEVPNVESVSWDRTIDADAAQCTIVIANIKMKPNAGPQPDPNELGLPGYYTPTRGDHPDATARWPNHVGNPWAGVLSENAILRTYEGYGGLDLSIQDAVTAGNLRQTGTWMVDSVKVSTDGTLTLECRDMARLLIEQHIQPPTVPTGIYPLRYHRWLPTETAEVRSGNYFDYSDIIYDLLIWSGFFYDVHPWQEFPTLTGGPPPGPVDEGWAQVHGVIETTGAYADDVLPDDLFDKRPVIDAITDIRNIVGYLFWINEEGGANFRSPNWWAPGNFDENLNHVAFTPVIDERVNATGYTMVGAAENIRSRIVISSEAVPPVPPYGSSAEAYAAYNDAVSRATFYEPPGAAAKLHGMDRPAMWINGAFTDPTEQLTMAQLIAMHIFYRSRQGSLSMLGNPCITIDDQVRIYERQTSEAYIHYVRGVQSNLNNRTGVYKMTLTTNWLGDGNDWSGDQFSGLRVVNV